jgi:hypothetical protein
VNNDKRCPRCGEGQIKSWSELSDEEHEVVKRLPSTAGYEAAELETMLQWCTRCWYQSMGDETLT